MRERARAKRDQLKKKANELVGASPKPVKEKNRSVTKKKNSTKKPYDMYMDDEDQSDMINNGDLE